MTYFWIVGMGKVEVLFVMFFRSFNFKDKQKLWIWVEGGLL